MTNEELAILARRTAEASYSPYSGFRVGAVAVGKNGETFTGVNVENASYAMTACAEATAIHNAVSQGLHEIETVAVACVDAEDTEGAYPCGSCRQIMAEFDVERVVVTAGDGSEVREHTLEELFPHRFDL